MNKDEAREAADKAYFDERHKAVNRALEATPAQISVEMFAMSVASKAYDLGHDAGVASVDRRAIVSELKRKVTMITALLTGDRIADNQHRLGLIGSIDIDEACRILHEVDAVLAEMGANNEQV